MCSFAETLFEHMNLLNRDYTRRYCVFVWSDNNAEEDKRRRQYMKMMEAQKMGAGLTESLLPLRIPNGQYNNTRKGTL
jgi:hypothetical protein